MSLVLQNPLSNTTYRIKFYSQIITTTRFNPTKTLKFSLFHRHSLQFKAYPLHRNISYLQNRLSHIKSLNSPITAFEEEQKSSTQLFKFDAFLLFLESICIVSSVLISFGCFVNWVLFKQHNHGVVMLGNRILIWLLAGAVGVGAVIRQRQWMRVCGPSRSKSLSESGNVIERIEKLEESMRSSTSIIRMLSKQLEKLGIRFRLTRKSLKEPISETAALAQKNSEATRALAVQEGILEKELAEVQNVLLAMQDQQQKQLELILAIAKSGKLIDNKQAPSQGSDTNKRVSDNGLRQAGGQQVQAMAAQKGTANERASGS